MDPVFHSASPSFLTRKCTYSEETRLDKVRRYQRKKSERVWRKKTLYDCRKEIANTRQRVKGRFTKKDSFSHESKKNEEVEMNKSFIPIESFF